MAWQWHQLNHMQIICTSLQTDNHASTPPLINLQAGCPSCCPTNSVKALKVTPMEVYQKKIMKQNKKQTRSPAIAEGPRDAGVPVEIW